MTRNWLGKSAWRLAWVRGWAIAAALINTTGLMYGYRIADGAILTAYGHSYTWPFVLGYAGIAIVFWALAANQDQPIAH